MKRFVLLISTLALMPAVAFSQTTDNRRGWGYAFAGIGATSGHSTNGRVHFGGGGEGLIAGGFGLGGELGYNASTESVGDGFGIGSVNLSYHFNSSRKWAPFVTGGASLGLSGFGIAGGGNFGAGVNYWASDHVGWRFEFRDHIFSSDTPHYYGIRVGITFR